VFFDERLICTKIKYPRGFFCIFLLGASHLFKGFYNGLMTLPILGFVTTFEVMV
ncbi:hypothetical protein GIB67_035908, partial [Kingdonia uniflora]